MRRTAAPGEGKMGPVASTNRAALLRRGLGSCGRLFVFWLLLVLFVLLVFSAAEELLEDVLLLFLLGLLRGIGSVSVGRGVGGLADDWCAGCRWWHCGFGG